MAEVAKWAGEWMEEVFVAEVAKKEEATEVRVKMADMVTSEGKTAKV
jgi:hypothetical protein